MRLDKRWLALAVLVAALVLFFAFDLGQYLSLEAIKTRQAQLEGWRAAQPLQAALIFFGAYVLVTALSLPGATVMTLAGGAVFGLGWGTLLISFASSIGATLAFLASRWLLGGWVQQRFAERLKTFNEGMERDGAFYLFTLRLVPLVPFFVINLAMGLTRIRPLTFYGVSQLGMFPATLVYVNAGTQLAQINSLAGIVSPGLLGSLVLLGVFALIRSARMAADVKRAGEFGIRTAASEVDFAAAMERVQRVIEAIEPHDSVERYTELGVDVASGTARITSPWQVQITHNDGHLETLSTRSIVIATGGRPFIPPIAGLEQVDYLTSETIWALRERPKRLLVLGGGPIGCELAQTFARLGCRVTQVEQGERLLPREDTDVAELVAQRFAAEGIDLRLGHEATRIEVLDSGEKTLLAQHAGGTVRIAFDALLIAVGRRANLDGFGLQELGVETSRTVEVNAFLQTNFPNIYAAGDVAGPYQFTHVAAHQAWYAAVNALFDPFKKFKADYRVIPWATFTEPEVARVGLNELEAQEKKIAHEVTVYRIDDLDRAIAEGEAHGFVKVLTPPGKDRILGVTIVGAHAGELIAEYVLAMKHGIGLNKILGTIHIYPTMAEANKYAAGAWKRAHAPERLLGWVARFHAWRRG